jgi:hypothetical protein
MRARGRLQAGLGFESRSSAGEDKGPDRQAPPVSARERKREGACAWAGGPGRTAGGPRAGGKGEKGRGRPWAGPQGEERKRRRKKGKWASPNRKKRGIYGTRIYGTRCAHLTIAQVAPAGKRLRLSILRSGIGQCYDVTTSL